MLEQVVMEIVMKPVQLQAAVVRVDLVERQEEVEVLRVELVQEEEEEGDVVWNVWDVSVVIRMASIAVSSVGVFSVICVSNVFANCFTGRGSSSKKKPSSEVVKVNYAMSDLYHNHLTTAQYGLTRCQILMKRCHKLQLLAVQPEIAACLLAAGI